METAEFDPAGAGQARGDEAGRGLKDIGAMHIADLDGLVFKPRGKHLDLPGFLKAERVGKTLVLYRQERP